MKFNRIIIAVSFVWLLVSWWNRNEIPGTVDYVPELANEPVQKRTQKRPFDLIFNDVSYRVEPEYEYDITGMIVSYPGTDRLIISGKTAATSAVKAKSTI